MMIHLWLKTSKQSMFGVEGELWRIRQPRLILSDDDLSMLEMIMLMVVIVMIMLMVLLGMIMMVVIAVTTMTIVRERTTFIFHAQLICLILDEDGNGNDDGN